MRKYIVLLLILAVASMASAQVKFKDVPEDHWAAPYVYELVKLGVTKGYPDGTFRGTKKITRYETAVFLAKLANALGGDLKQDVAALKKDIASLKQGGGLGMKGSLASNWKLGNLLTSAGGVRAMVANYRLILTSETKLSDKADVIVNLDTMDYGYFDSGATSTGGILATQLLDIESNLQTDLSALGFANPVDFKITYGPGAQQHNADPTGALPSEVGVVYARPDTGVVASTSLWGMDVAGGYKALELATSGKVNTSDLTAAVGYTFSGVPVVNTLRVDTTADYIATGILSSSTRDIRGTISMAAPLAEKVSASGTLGMGGSKTSSLMVAGELGLNDLWDTGTVVTARVSKIGSTYLNSGTFADAEFDMAGLDAFDRALQNGTVNLGGELVQNVSDSVKLVGKGELRLNGNYQYDSPNGAITAQGGVLYAVAPNTNLDASYRLYQSKSSNDTSDIAAVGLMYNF